MTEPRPLSPEEALLARILDYMVEFRGLLRRFWETLRVLGIVLIAVLAISGILAWQIQFRNKKVDQLDNSVTDIGAAVKRIDKVASQVDQNSDAARVQREQTQELFNAVFRMDCLLTGTKSSCDRVGLPSGGKP